MWVYLYDSKNFYECESKHTQTWMNSEWKYGEYKRENDEVLEKIIVRLSRGTMKYLTGNSMRKQLYHIKWHRNLSRQEPEFKTSYIKLSKQVSGFATELLAQTRSSEELHIILNHDAGSPVSINDHEKTTLSRLKLAIRYKQKEVSNVTDWNRFLGK